jgi:hypothetical protein
MSSEWPFSFRTSTKIYKFLISVMCTTCSIHLTLRDLITLNIIWWRLQFFTTLLLLLLSSVEIQVTAEKRAIIKPVIQTPYLQNYKNVSLKYTTKLVTFWARRLQGDLHPCANNPLTSTQAVLGEKTSFARFFAAPCTRCDFEVPGVILLRELKKAMRLDRSKDMSVHVSICTSCLEVVALVRRVCFYVSAGWCVLWSF